MRPAQVLCRAESVQFVEGAQWDERHAGTNAPGRDTTLGVIDITGDRDAGSPQTIAMVRAGARLAVSELARHALIAASRYPESPRAGVAGPRHGTAEISLSGLGRRSECLVSIGPRTVKLSPRHSEITVILSRRAGRRRVRLPALPFRRDLGHSATCCRRAC